MSRFAKLAVLVGAIAAFAGASVAHAGIDTNAVYRITTSHSLALDVEGGSWADGARVIQWGVNGGRNQQWTFQAMGSGYYEIVNRNSGKCLTISGNSVSAGAGLVQWVCRGAANQLWYVRQDAFGYSFMAWSSGLYVDVPGESPQWGLQLQQWTYNSYSWSQTFVLTVLA